jgi:hypothetical protein
MKPKIFISSLISSMIPFRAAAKEAIEQLECEAIMAENFGARPTSPQIACLQGVRQTAAVVLLMGKPEAVHLRPGHRPRPRPALAQRADQIVDDLTALLRREWKNGRF